MEAPRPGVEQNWLQRWLLTLGGYYSRESRLLRGAKVLYRGIVEQATNKPLYDGAGATCCHALQPGCFTHAMHSTALCGVRLLDFHSSAYLPSSTLPTSTCSTKVIHKRSLCVGDKKVLLCPSRS